MCLWQMYKKLSTLPCLAFKFNYSTMHLYGFFYNIEAQSIAWYVLRVAGAIEGFKKAFLVFGGDANAVVANANHKKFLIKK